MSAYTVTLTADELLIVEVALGRKLAARKVAERKPAAAKRYTPKPPKLVGGQFAKVEARWAEACANPTIWHNQLGVAAAMATGRSSLEQVKRAWGIVDKADEVAA